MHAHHRDHFEHEVHFHPVVPLPMQSLVDQTFRLLYIRVGSKARDHAGRRSSRHGGSFSGERFDGADPRQPPQDPRRRLQLEGSDVGENGGVDGRLAMMDPMRDVAEPVGLLYELLFSACSDNADAISDYFRWHRG